MLCPDMEACPGRKGAQGRVPPEGTRWQGSSICAVAAREAVGAAAPGPHAALPPRMRPALCPLVLAAEGPVTEARRWKGVGRHATPAGRMQFYRAEAGCEDTCRRSALCGLEGWGAAHSSCASKAQ